MTLLSYQEKFSVKRDIMFFASTTIFRQKVIHRL